MLRAFLVALLALAPVTVALGQTPGVDAALEAYRQGELYRALELFSAAIEAPGNSPEDLVTIHVHLGILKGSLADMDGARTAFETALAIDASLETPEELNPELREVWAAVATERGGRSLAVEAQAEDAEADRDFFLNVRVTGAPDGLVAGVRARVTAPGAGPITSERVDVVEGRARLTVPGLAWRGGRRLEIETEVLDQWGGVVARHDTTVDASAPAIVAPPLTDELDDDDDGGLLASPWFWIITGVVVLGAAAAITAVLLTRDTQAVVGPPMERP